MKRKRPTQVAYGTLPLELRMMALCLPVHFRTKVWITELLNRDPVIASHNLERAFAESDTARRALTFFEHSIATGEPVPPKVLENVRHMTGGAAASTLLESASLFRAAKKRAAAIGPRNEKTQQDAKDRHQKIREVARELERTTRRRLQKELSKRGLSVSIKQISRALSPKK